MDENKQIAATILSQLGGRRFTVMTGAKNFAFDGPSLQFRLPTRGKKTVPNHVSIRLNINDLYDVTFSRIRGMNCTEIEKVENVFCEDLTRIFESATGLATRL
jgi:hypothetical protein